MTWKYLTAGALLAATVLATTSASATVITGYTDLYVTDMHWHVGNDDFDDYTWPCRYVGRDTACAKVRFNFSYDNKLPPHTLRANFVLLEDYHIPNIDAQLPETETVSGVTYLRGPIDYAVPGPTFEQLGPKGFSLGPWYEVDCGQPGGCDRTYDLKQFVLPQPGNTLALTFDADQKVRWDWPCPSELCSLVNQMKFGREFLNLTPGGEGLFVASASAARNSTWSFFYNIIFRFNNDPKYWVSGAPQARVWTYETSDVPEPASLSLLGAGLLALAAARSTHRRG